jgi:hypothetical protein
MVIEFDWLEKANNMMIEVNLINMLVDRGENNGYAIQPHQVWFGKRIRGHLSILIDGDIFPLRDSP